MENRKGVASLFISANRGFSVFSDVCSPTQKAKLAGSARARSKSRPPLPGYGGSSKGWVSRYRPGLPVPIPRETARESIMQAKLRQKESEFCDPMEIR